MRPTSSRRSVWWISASTPASTDDVASSSSRIRGIAQQRPGERDALALAAREREPLLADDGVVAVGQADHELVRLDRARRGFDVGVVGIGPGERDVVADGVGEEERVLEHDADLLAQRRERDVADVDVVDADRAFVHVVEARQQQPDGGLARNPRCRRARRSRPGATVSEKSRSTGSVRRYPKVTASNVTSPRVGLSVGRVRSLLHERRAVEQLEDALGAGPGELRDRQHAGEHPHRRDEGEHVAREREEDAEADLALEREPAAEREHRDHPERRDRLHQRLQARLHAHEPQARAEQAAGAAR